MKRIWTVVRAILGFATALALLLLVPLFFYNYAGHWLVKMARILNIR